MDALFAEYDAVQILEPGPTVRVTAAWDRNRLTPVSITEFACVQNERAVREQIRWTQQTLGRLSHLGLLPLLDWRVADGRVALVYASADSPDIRQAAERPDDASVEEIGRLAKAVADALDRAHGHRLYHGRLDARDIHVAPDGRMQIAHLGRTQIIVAAAGAWPDQWDAHQGVPPEASRERRVRVGTEVYGLAALVRSLLDLGGAAVPDSWRPVLQAAGAADPKHRPPTIQALARELDAFGSVRMRASSASAPGPTPLESRMLDLLSGEDRPRTSIPVRRRPGFASRLAAGLAAALMISTVAFVALGARGRQDLRAWVSSTYEHVLGHEDELAAVSRRLSAASLADMPRDERLALLIGYLRHDRSSVREIAAGRLARETGAQARTAVGRLLLSPDRRVRFLARWCLSRLQGANRRQPDSRAHVAHASAAILYANPIEEGVSQ